jgi:adenosylcobinamide-GDP ribazoletransferase
MLKKIWNNFKVAFSMYSRIPMPVCDWTEENTSYTMCFFPWIGAVIGAITYGIYGLKLYLAGKGIVFAELFWTILLVLVPIIITGGIHLDGYLDTKDALSSYQSKERRLEILKDPHAGAFAIISCGVYLLAYVGVYSSLTSESVKVIALTFMVSRAFSGLAVVTFPQARRSGEGIVATFSGNAATQVTRWVLCIYLLLLAVLLILVGGYAGVAAILTAAGVYAYYHHMAISRFGGITGDLAGYFLQVCELAMAAVIVICDVL